ncbi:MAG: S49 family peptidase, partial [Armatimonadetes bacterium]|nr:S49 family peptidase [Armatimonadota bacterium]
MRKTGTVENNLLPLAAVHDSYWAIEEKAAALLLQMLGSTDARVHRSEYEARDHGHGLAECEEFEMADGVAVISIVGVMTKSPTSLEPGCSTVLARRQIRAAAHDVAVRAIVIRFDSPGGTVSGTEALANDVREAAAHKKVYAYVEDSCCSAAYWVASQCNKVFASKTALVGSLGIYTTPSLVAAYFDSFASILTVWLAVGVFVMIGGLIYAELGTR